jgi:prevent-host-death family protein
MTWPLAEAKNKLSEVVNKAVSEGPQRIRRRGDVVVVISEAEYERLTGKQGTLKDAILKGPDLSGLDLSRDSNPMRDIEW